MSQGLGHALVAQGVLSHAALAEAEQAQSTRGGSLGSVLVDMQLATEDQIVGAVAAQLGLPYVDLAPGTVDPMAASLVSRQLALELQALPVQFGQGNTVLVAITDPGNEAALQRVAELTGMDVYAALTVRGALEQAILHLTEDAEPAEPAPPAAGHGHAANGHAANDHAANAHAANGHAGEGRVGDDHAETDPTKLLEYERTGGFDLDGALTQLMARNGSDLHLTAGIPPAVRVHGELEHLPDLPALDNETLRKALYGILTQRQRERFENELELDVSYTIPGHGRFRVNVFQQRDSIGAVMRLIPFEIKPLASLGVPAQVANFCYQPRGLVLVTGPTGSGKSTTLASMIDIINTEKAAHIMTVEDPIEFLHRHKRSVVNQRELGSDTHSFGHALKHVLRQDPDVILVGELRDLETIQLAITAAETGHLVFGTLHTQDAPQTVDRIIDVFPPHQQEQIRVMLATSLQGVVTQQLLKTADGTGRVVACEVLVGTAAIRNLIREGKTHQMYSALQAGKQHGMIAMDQSLANLVKAGKVTYNHALERCKDVNDFNRLCGRA